MAVTTRRFRGGCRPCSQVWFRLDGERRGMERVRIRGEKNNLDLEKNINLVDKYPMRENLN